MRQATSSLVVVLVLVAIVPVQSQMPVTSPVNDWASTVITRQAGAGFPNEPSGKTLEPARLAVPVTPPPLERQEMIPAPILNPGGTTLAADATPLQLIDEVHPRPSASDWRLQLIAAQPAVQPQSPLRVARVFTYKFKNATVPGVAGNPNYSGPDVTNPRIHEVSLELGLSVMASPTTTLFADLNTKYTSDTATTIIGIERLHLTMRDTLGVQGLNSRIGRDGIRLGAEGLLLDEVLHDDDRRDGVQLWLPPGRAVRWTGFVQYALEDRTTTRRLWGGRADADVYNGWTLGLNYRADTAAAIDAGACPGTTCNTGSGFGADAEGSISPGVELTLALARYTQTGDVARTHDQVDLVLDFDQFSGPSALHPVLTLWYKNFDPYTIPGADGTVARGGFLTPDDFKLFSVNDNLAAVGSRVDLQLTSDLALLVLGEWGFYKTGGQNYNVYSVGLRHSFPQNSIVKLSYNAYAVAGGSVTTSPISGISLSNATVYQLEFTKSW